MKLAVFGEGKKKEINKLIELMDEVKDWDFRYADEKNRKAIQRVMLQLDGMRHIISHLLMAYETVFDNVCDPKAEALEFKQELVAFTDCLENKADSVRFIAEERIRQIKKWGDTEGHDWQHKEGQLLEVARDILNGESDMWCIAERHPSHIDRLRISAALIAAEIDRIQYESKRSESNVSEEAPHA